MFVREREGEVKKENSQSNMVKKLDLQSRSWWRSPHKNINFAIKLGVSILLVGLAFMLIYNRSSDSSTVAADPFPANSIFADSQENSYQVPAKESINSERKCNPFVGEWVYEAEPHYTNRSCSFIYENVNCLSNGRPDTDYLYWRWNPRDCKLARLDPRLFLELMRNKSWAFIGDSISGNHVHSILCILSMVEEAKEVYHDESFKSRRWAFPLHNFTISTIWSPLLAHASIFEDQNGVTSAEMRLHLDILDKEWTEHYKSFDYVMISVGKWFTKNTIYLENNTVLGCYNCSSSEVNKLGFNFAYRRVMRNAFNYITESKYKGVIFYRTSPPDHFEGGEWFSGGTCERTAPVKEGGFELNKQDKALREVELEELENVTAKAAEKGVDLRVFDVHPMSLMRPDGHPGPYRFFQPYAKDKNAKVIKDCLHWCLPGPIDSWNDVLMEMIVNG